MRREIIHGQQLTAQVAALSLALARLLCRMRARFLTYLQAVRVHDPCVRSLSRPRQPVHVPALAPDVPPSDCDLELARSSIDGWVTGGRDGASEAPTVPYADVAANVPRATRPAPPRHLLAGDGRQGARWQRPASLTSADVRATRRSRPRRGRPLCVYPCCGAVVLRAVWRAHSNVLILVLILVLISCRPGVLAR